MKHTKVQRNSKPKKKFHKNVIHARSLKEGRIIVRNLPFKATEDAIKKFFRSCGPIREVNLLRRPDGNPVGCAFIQFNDIKVAKQAIDSCSGNQFMGRDISADLALEQGRYITHHRPDLALKTKDRSDEYEEPYNEEYEEEGEPKPDEDWEEAKPDEDWEEEKPDEGGEDVQEAGDEEMPPGSSDVPTATTLPKRKRPKAKVKTKKARVVVRNVSFKATEDELKKHFGAYGSLVDVQLLRRPDGRLVGCAFLQYQNLKEAAAAIKQASGLNFLGRPAVLDWAVAKNEYETKTNPKEEIKIKDEPMDEDEIKIENDEDEIRSIKSESGSDVMSEGEGDEDDEYDEDEDEDEDKEKPAKPAEKYCSNDVSEGRTVFVKNIPFSVGNQALKACMEQFGELEYAVICYDQFTEHSKGSGFVKFKDLESTRKCLEAGTELTLQGQILDCHKALDRETIKTKGKTTTDKKTLKDNRNLYLVKEGVVLAGSKAAENVSVTDMAKRLKLEQLKTQMLRNLNMFVSNTRLVVHNLPPSYDDRRVRELFERHSGPGATVVEARVMRDTADVDEHGVGRSKETAFVRFAAQQDALVALRTLNNNPNVFTVSKRPIVAFAIENRQIHKIKQLREQKSREKNPQFKTPEQPLSAAEKKTAKRKRRLAKRKARGPDPGGKESGTAGVKEPGTAGVPPPKKKKAKTVDKDVDQSGGSAYVGVAAEPGNTRMRTKYNLKAQASLHTQAVRKDKQKKRSNKKVQQQQKIQREHIKQPKQKQGRKKNHQTTTEDESFSKLVNTYKSKITPAMMKSKWYDES